MVGRQVQIWLSKAALPDNYVDLLDVMSICQKMTLTCQIMMLICHMILLFFYVLMCARTYIVLTTIIYWQMPSNWAKICVCHKRRGTIKCHKRRPTIKFPPCSPPPFVVVFVTIFQNLPSRGRIFITNFLLLLHWKFRIVTIISILYQFTTLVRCLFQNEGFGFND